MIETSLLAVAKQSKEVIDLYLSDQTDLSGIVVNYNDDMLIFRTKNYYHWIYRSEIIRVCGDEKFFREFENYRKQLAEERQVDGDDSSAFADEGSKYLPDNLPEIPYPDYFDKR